MSEGLADGGEPLERPEGRSYQKGTVSEQGNTPLSGPEHFSIRRTLSGTRGGRTRSREFWHWEASVSS